MIAQKFALIKRLEAQVLARPVLRVRRVAHLVVAVTEGRAHCVSAARLRAAVRPADPAGSADDVDGLRVNIAHYKTEYGEKVD